MAPWDKLLAHNPFHVMLALMSLPRTYSHCVDHIYSLVYAVIPIFASLLYIIPVSSLLPECILHVLASRHEAHKNQPHVTLIEYSLSVFQSQ